MRTTRSVWFSMMCVLVMFLTIPPLGCQSSSTAESDGDPADETNSTPSDESDELVSIPLGLPDLTIPEDNPMTAEKIELGKLLYFDKRVSKDETISCATCHDPTKGWTEHEPTSKGIDHQMGGRNSPTVINAAYAPAQFWDGRAKTLEEQAVGPVGNPIEMGNSMTAVVDAFNKIPGYVERFQEVFGTDVTEDGFAKAIAAFERTVLSGDSAYDQYKEGDESALDGAQTEGLDLFEGSGCADCHKAPMFSTYAYVNAGVDAEKEVSDKGRMAVTGDENDFGKFRIPSLRDVTDTGPYFHDGSISTLEEAIALMASGGKDNPNLDPNLKEIRDAELTPEDQAKIAAFLETLSGKYPVIEPPLSFPEAAE